MVPRGSEAVPPSSRLPLKFAERRPMVMQTTITRRLRLVLSDGKDCPMDDDLRQALTSLLRIRDGGQLFDRESDEGGYTSQELEDILDVIENALDQA